MMDQAQEKPCCFVIMPIADREPYTEGHFRRVYNDIIRPACEIAEHRAMRADEVKNTNLIHADILKRLIESPMAVCDLSSHNPNVMFELALRQAFDKPTVLIQERGTGRIFDISPLRTIDYEPTLGYRDVLAAQKEVAQAISETANAPETDLNSIVRLLALSSPASIPNLTEEKTDAGLHRVILSQLSSLQEEVRQLRGRSTPVGRLLNHQWATAGFQEELLRRALMLRDSLEGGLATRAEISHRYTRLVEDLVSVDPATMHPKYRREVAHALKELEEALGIEDLASRHILRMRGRDSSDQS